MSAIDPTSVIKARPFKEIIPIICILVAVIGLYNLWIPWPSNDDFSGLALHCLLMEKKGLRYAIGDNWGFAHPLVHYLLTKITGNLLVSQRILSGAFTVFTTVLAYHILHGQLGFVSRKQVFLALALLLTSYFYLEMILSCHFDIAPISLLMVGLYYLDKPVTQRFFWIGFVVGMAYWFRFHFLIYAMGYPLLVWLAAPAPSTKKTFFSVAGVLLALLVPHLLCFQAFSVWGFSNFKFVIAEMSIPITAAYWTCSNQLAIQGIPLPELIDKVEMLTAVRRFITNLTYGPEVFLPLTMAVNYWFLSKTEKQPANNFGNPAGRIAWIGMYLVVCFLPLLFLRGATSRLMAAFFIPYFPYLTYICLRHLQWYKGLVWIMIISLAWRDVSNWAAYRQRRLAMTEIHALAYAYIPEALLTGQPERVLATDEFYNKYNPYLLTNPVLISNWQCRYEPFRNYFDTLEVHNLPNLPLKNRYDYLILPQDSLKAAAFPFSVLDLQRQAQVVAKGKYATIMRVERE